MITLSTDRHPTEPLQHAFLVRHALSDHPLLSPAGIRALAGRLPPDSAEPGLQGMLAEGGLDYVPPAMTDASRSLAELEGEHRSVYLYNAEQDEHVGALVAELLAGVYDELAVDRSSVVKEEGYVFLTGGPTITSSHVDHEFNFLLLLRGQKRVFVADVPSEEGERALERMHTGGYGSCDAVPTEGNAFDIGPGHGVFIPPRGAHYVVNGDEPCAALSVVFRTADLNTQAAVYACNARLRRFGFRPSVVGRHPVTDRIKASVVGAARRSNRWTRRGR